MKKPYATRRTILGCLAGEYCIAHSTVYTEVLVQGWLVAIVGFDQSVLGPWFVTTRGMACCSMSSSNSAVRRGSAQNKPLSERRLKTDQHGPINQHGRLEPPNHACQAKSCSEAPPLPPNRDQLPRARRRIGGPRFERNKWCCSIDGAVAPRR